MKQRIRLTESDLHRMIKESVRQVLSELDWKTYHSAAKKTSMDSVRSPKFAKAAEEAFNKKYGSKDVEHHYGSDYYAGSTEKEYGLDDTYPQHPRTKLTLMSSGDKPEEYTYNPNSNEEFPLGHFNSSRGGCRMSYGNSNPKYQFGVDNPGGGFMSRLAAKGGLTKGPINIDAGNQELFDYENDNYEYQKGKGWMKKNN